MIVFLYMRLEKLPTYAHVQRQFTGYMKVVVEGTKQDDGSIAVKSIMAKS